MNAYPYWKRNLTVVWISQFLAMIGFGCCMPFIPLLLRENLHVDNEKLRGLYVSLYYLAGMSSLCVANIIWGILADRFGRKLMLLRASYAAALFYPLLSLAPNFGVLVLIRFICSFFSGTVCPAQTLLVSTTPPEKHGFVLGAVSTSIWSGNMLGYLAGGLIVHYAGFKTAFFTCGAIYLLSGALVHIFVKENFDYSPEKKKKVRFSFKYLSTPAVFWLLVMFLLMGIARRIEQPFIAMQVELVHGTDGAAFYTGIISAAAAVGGVLSGVAIGWICDRINPQKLIGPILVSTAAFTLGQAFSVNVEMLTVSRFLTYFAAGGLQPVLQVILAKTTSPELRGTFFGWSGGINTAGGIVCSFISGGLVLLSGVRSIFVTGALLTLLIFLPYFLFTRKESRQRKAV
ncbi:MAG: MFS transporter [Lentisphaeria bacterium]|nr:MFS transporter [Lentisphaeria bacterium]